MGKNTKFWETTKCKQCGSEFESLKSRKQRFCSNKCSTVFTANDKDRISKIKQTKIDKYGDAGYVNPTKAKQTCIERYGVDNVSKSKTVQDKIKQVNRDKFGCDSYFQTDEFKRKTKETLGVDNVSQLESTKQKVKQTTREKFGVDNVFQNEGIKQKIKKHYLDNHGVEHPSQVEEFQNKKLESSKRSFYNKLQTTHKLNLKVEPLFSIDDYINTDRNHKYKFKCLKCKSNFQDHIDGGHLPRCTKCYPLNKGSVCEKEIYDFVSDLIGTDQVSNNRRDVVVGKEIDIFLESKKIAIEYDSFYFHSQRHVGKKYHLDKTEACEALGVKLIHIFEDEWINKQEIVKSKLKNICGLVGERVYARNCSVTEISAKLKNEFLLNNHIQGEDKSLIKLGLFHKDELVAVMTFCGLRKALGSNAEEGVFELSRFATNKAVVGGAGKLFKHFVENFNPKKVISYADRRFSSSDSSLYDKIGFKLDSITPVNYWYFKNGYHTRSHRFNFRKSELPKKLKTFDPSLTEYENMQLNGYDRIWDCGNLKYSAVSYLYYGIIT
jgi:hypothetical protein